MIFEFGTEAVPLWPWDYHHYEPPGSSNHTHMYYCHPMNRCESCLSRLQESPRTPQIPSQLSDVTTYCVEEACRTGTVYPYLNNKLEEADVACIDTYEETTKCRVYVNDGSSKCFICSENVDKLLAVIRWVQEEQWLSASDLPKYCTSSTLLTINADQTVGKCWSSTTDDLEQQSDDGGTQPEVGPPESDTAEIVDCDFTAIHRDCLGQSGSPRSKKSMLATHIHLSRSLEISPDFSTPAPGQTESCIKSQSNPVLQSVFLTNNFPETCPALKHPSEAAETANPVHAAREDSAHGNSDCESTSQFFNAQFKAAPALLKLNPQKACFQKKTPSCLEAFEQDKKREKNAYDAVCDVIKCSSGEESTANDYDCSSLGSVTPHCSATTLSLNSVAVETNTKLLPKNAKSKRKKNLNGDCRKSVLINNEAAFMPKNEKTTKTKYGDSDTTAKSLHNLQTDHSGGASKNEEKLEPAKLSGAATTSCCFQLPAKDTKELNSFSRSTRLVRLQALHSCRANLQFTSTLNLIKSDYSSKDSSWDEISDGGSHNHSTEQNTHSIKKETDVMLNAAVKNYTTPAISNAEVRKIRRAKKKFHGVTISGLDYGIAEGTENKGTQTSNIF